MFSISFRLVNQSRHGLCGPRDPIFENLSLTVTSIDGVGTCDHLYLSALELLEVPKFTGLLPFARFAYAEPTSYVWEDEDGGRHHIRQGGESRATP